ncbi:MAG: amino acid adenylation domain-containing protein [Candidatus Polarisedimenticolia bacterium]
MLGRVRETTLGAFAHQELPFERLVEDLQPARDLGRNPIFDVALVLQNAPAGMHQVAGLSIGPFPFESWTTRFDLELHIWEGDGGRLEGYFFHNTDQYEASTAARLVERYTRLLSSIAQDPERRLSHLPIAATGEEDQSAVLARGSRLPVATVLPYALFEEQAARAPDAPALEQQGRIVSYGELEAAARRLAGRLRSLGAGRGSRIAVVASRSIEQVTMVLAAAKAGASYVPLEPAQPRARLLSMLDRLDASIVLAERDVAPGLAGGGRQVVTLDDDVPACQDAPPGKGPSPGLDDPAYVIFTSGSTGEPNGVEVTHRNLANLVAWHLSAFGVGPADRATLVAGVGFDASVWELWPCLGSGACLLIPDESTKLDPVALRDWLVAQRVTITFLPTPLAELVLALEWPLDGALRTLLTGGDRLHAVNSGRLPFRVVNNYGPTESTVVATSGEADGGGRIGSPTIGRPIANMHAFVLDARLRPAPIGVAGELYVGGAGVVRGYLGRPALTAARFLPDPSVPGARMYRTGDRARQLADGRIEFLGRVDAQVKIRGHRIEPAEVEAVLAAHPDVETAAVTVHDEKGEAKLVAYVAPRSGGGDRARWEVEHVSRWRDLYEETYRRTPADQDPSFNITGWNSSYTGAPIDAGEMREWRDRTVERILALGPRRALEIGCGTGLLLIRIAPLCERYVATDLSATSIALVRSGMEGNPGLAHVELLERMADDFAGLEAGSFDTIILNSVVQYFPDAAYLERVVLGAMRLLHPGGCLFVGDVRDARLHEAFAASVALHGAGGTSPIAEAGPLARRLIAREEELLVRPEMFSGLAGREPRGAWVEARPKSGRADNELTRFRYDVIVHVGAPRPAASVDLPWNQAAPSHLERHFRSGAGPIVVRGIPNARVVGSLEAARRLSSVEEPPAGPRPMHPDEASALGEAHGYAGSAFLSGTGEECFDVLFTCANGKLPASAIAFPARASGEGPPLANTPVRGTVAATLMPMLRAFAAGRLPETMVPSTFIVLDALPLTPNGKIDRRALPPPGGAPSRRGVAVAPRSPVEREIARVWEEVLGIDGVSVTDNFFELGGHSLLATQVISRLRTALGVELPLRAIFEAPTVETLASLSGDRRQEAVARPCIPRAPDVIRRKLSHAQQRLWFLDRLAPGSAVYNVAGAFRIAGALDTGALDRALSEIDRRHEVLRTRIVETGDEPASIFAAPRSQVLAIEDLARSDDPTREAMRRIHEQAATPFDLERDPLWRALLMRTGEREHLLSFVLHHLVTDGWSMDRLAEELALLYGAFAAGDSSPLADLPIQYADWAAWQRSWLEGGELERQLAWWRARLDGLERLEMPTDRPRPASRGLRGASLGFELPPREVAALERIARAEGASLFHALLACFQALLARHAASDDVVVGTPIANRAFEETERLIGFFSNTLPVRTRVDAGLTMRGLLRRVRETMLDAAAHQDVPFEAIVDALHVDRDVSRNPLFDAMFALQQPAAPAVPAAGLAFQPLAADTGATAFDLSLGMACEGGKVLGSLHYDADLFEPETARRFVSGLETLVRALGQEPDRLVEEIDLRPPHERGLEARVNATRVERPARVVHALVEEQAARAPGAVAVLDEDGPLSYGELDAMAGRIALRLRAAGVGPEQSVALLAGRRSSSIAGLLGIFKSGGVLVPLDASLPPARMAAMMRVTAVRAVVSERGLHRALPVDGPPVILLDALDLAETRIPAFPMGSPSQAAYVIFTSGSTGEPKGSIVEHRSLADRTLAMAARMRLGPGDRVLHFLSPLFDASLSEILPALAAGATVVVHPDPQGETPAGFLDHVKEARLTVATLPVGLVHELADHVARAPAEIPPPLRLLITGGESPSAARAAALLRAACGRLALVNSYGPTETCILASDHTVSPDSEIRDPIPIGLPVDNTTLHCLDDRMKPVPVGALGEIHIGGIGLARGYAGRPAETAWSFVPDPFCSEPGARLYRTGDIGRRRADGSLVFMGRRDGQVKLRGYRIELGEIEAALARLDGVREGVASLRADRHGPSLIGYIVPAPGVEPDPSRLRAALRQFLPDYMVPADIVVLERMPRTRTGKVDRRALPAPAVRGRLGDMAPRDDQERAIARVWGETLALETVDVEESFFEAGGHSLLAVRLVGSLRRELGLDLPVAAVFREPTVAGLAALWRGTESPPGGRDISPLVRIRSGSGLPPVVCFHAAGGGVADFARLAAHLDRRRSVYAIHGMDGRAPADVEKAGAHWADEIGRTLGSGAVHLVGWSYGGLVAYETARQLREKGRTVGALILLDASAPRPGMEDAVPAISPDALPAGVDERDALTWIAGMEARVAAARDYRPRPYEGDVVVVRGTESASTSHDDALGWEGLVRGRLTLAWALGSHESILEGEGARTVAAIVEQH